ncbi:MAG: BspA family leucine-rich repeat surface protein [Faecousia sp.]
MEKVSAYPCPHCGYDSEVESAFPYALRPGTILNGKYVVGTVLGQGGFGITYTGWDLSLECKVAIKEYFPSAQVSRTQSSQGTLQWYNTEAGRTARDSGREMFLKEARKMARVRDIPQVVRVLDLFQQNNTAYIVMDFVEGETLKNRLKKTGPMSWDQAKEIFLPAIDAMERVHKLGLIHRDLSPDNLMLTPDSSVRILDLGAAKDLNINTGASSMQVAKGGFSPLEQYIQTGGSGPWTDVYAMAATMYYTLTGVLPLPSVDRLAEDTLRWDLPQLMALPDNVLTALQKAMAISPKARTQSMAEFSSQLTAPVTAPPQQPERKVEPDRDKGTEVKAVENKKPETAPQPKKEPAPKENEVPGDTAVSGKKEESSQQPKNLTLLAVVLTLLAIIGIGMTIWYMKKNPAGPAASEKDPIQIQETEGSSPTENNTDTALDDASAKEIDLIPNTLGINPLQQMGIERETIQNIAFLNTLDTAPSDVTDVSVYHDGSVLAWVEKNDVYIAAEGKINAQYCENMFNGCSLLETVSFGDAFNTEKATSMEAMFYKCPNLKSADVEVFDTSNVTNMKNMFALIEYDGYVRGFAEYKVEHSNLQFLDVSGWNTSSVCDMSGMFTGCKTLEQLDVSAWDLSSVTDLGGTFAGCEKLEYLDVSNWNLSAVTNMWGTFCNCYSLKTLDVSNWDTSKVTSMMRLFSFCQTLEELDVANWDTSSVTDMGCVFEFCENVRALEVGNWDVSNVTSLESTFRHCKKVISLDVASWNTSNVTWMDLTFCENENLSEVDVSGWDVSNVQNMDFMFWCCDDIKDLKVNNWDVSSCQSYEAFMNDSGKINGRPWMELFAN